MYSEKVFSRTGIEYWMFSLLKAINSLINSIVSTMSFSAIHFESGGDDEKIVTWLILPVVICLSQRLSHACLSINKFVLWNCEWLIKSVIVYLIIPYYLDNRGNSRANTCYNTRLQEGLYWLDTKPTRVTGFLVIHNHFSNRMALSRRWFIQISALSTFDGRIEAYHGFNG